MIAPVDTGYATMLAIVGGLGALIGIAIYVWYAYALSRLFPRIDGEGWKGWVPILNEAEILARGGVPAWSVVFYFIPIVQLYGIYLKVVATHRINRRFGRGAGMTVLAILLPPVWATVLAWGAPPYPEGERLAALQPGPRRNAQPAAAPARDASGYTIPSLAPHAPSQPDAPALVFPDYAAPTRANAQAQADAGASAPRAPSGADGHAPSAWGAPPQKPQPPVGPPRVPDATPAAGAPPVPGAPPIPLAGQPPAPGAPAASFAPPQPPAPAYAQQPPAPPQPPAPGHEQPPAPRPPAPAPVAAPAPQPPAPAPAPASAPPVDAHPTTGIMAAMGGDPVATVAPQSPAPPEPVSDDFAVQPPAPPAPASMPVSPSEIPAEHSPSTAPAGEPQRAVRPAPPSFRDGGLSAEHSQTPTIRPAPSASGGVPTAAEVPIAEDVSVAATPPAPAADAPAAAPAAEPFAMPLGGLAADVDKTVVTPRPTDDVVDDLDATVVVARRRGIRRSLVLDDGRTFSLSGASVVIGRNPIGEPGEQRLAISDTTRTLSKTHARLVVHDDEWRLTDLHATNGVVVVEENGTETLLDPGESVTGNGRFILGEVGMHVIAERDS
ncbi:DUF5684 domain-containing protein [Microbacterium sp. NPDC087589]|uniref:DUF5684 domain-containing protein n=1 Tax=Microbacterium sp. NPDC087589 TaxID=3364191 RepID=UPI0037FEAD1D